MRDFREKHNDRLDPDIIKSGLNTKKIGKKVIVFKSTSSTNDIAAEYGRDTGNDGTVIFAEHQEEGRGRADHKWESEKSQSILCSIILNSNLPCSEMLSLVSAVAVSDTVGTIAGKHARIKWPNDIILNGKKTAGVLNESRIFDYGRCCITGIGINCHQKSFPSRLHAKATSLDMESDSICSRNLISRCLLSCFEYRLEQAKNSPERIIESWTEKSLLLGRRVTVLYNRKKYSGCCIGIDRQKGRILQLDTGGVRMFDAACTSREEFTEACC